MKIDVMSFAKRSGLAFLALVILISHSITAHARSGAEGDGCKANIGGQLQSGQVVCPAGRTPEYDACFCCKTTSDGNGIKLECGKKNAYVTSLETPDDIGPSRPDFDGTSSESPGSFDPDRTQGPIKADSPGESVLRK